MEKIICPYCEKDLAEDMANKLTNEEYSYSIAKINSAGSCKLFPGGIMFYALITCPNCNKILGAVNNSPIPVPESPEPFKKK